MIGPLGRLHWEDAPTCPNRPVVSDEYALYCGGKKLDDVPTSLELDPNFGAWVITALD